jgi:hypothetical protein
MWESIKPRLIGLGLLLLAAVSALVFLVAPLHEAENGTRNIDFHVTPIIGIGLFVPIGLFMLIIGDRIPLRDAASKQLTRVGLLVTLIGFVLGGALWWWTEQQFDALGYQ